MNKPVFADLIASISADFGEIASRGINHPQGDEISGRLRVSLEKAANEVGAPDPEPDPVQVQLDRLAAAVEKLAAARQ